MSKVGKEEMTITYQEVCILALGYKYNGNNVYTVTYTKGENDKHGSLTKNEEVVIVDGMIFDVKEEKDK